MRDDSYTHFPSQSPTDKITATMDGGSRRPQSFADYSVIENFGCSIHGSTSSMCCSIILQEILNFLPAADS